MKKDKVFKVRVTNPDAWGHLGMYYGTILDVRLLPSYIAHRSSETHYLIVSDIGFECIRIEDCERIGNVNLIGGRLYGEDEAIPKAIGS